jgi:hypothetical protein
MRSKRTEHTYWKKKENTMKKYSFRILLTALLIGIVPTATLWATPIFDPLTNTCTTLNCGAVRIDGVVRLARAANETAGGEVRPWVMEIFANPNQCLRAHVIAQDADLEAVLVAPNGNVFRNDDSGLTGCLTCPLLKVNPTPGPNRGFYTLQISHFAGSPVTANFVLMYGLYNLGNPNCSAPTLPTATNSGESLKPKSAP